MFEKIFQQVKSAGIPCYKKFFYFTAWLTVIPEYKRFFFRGAWSSVILKCKKWRRTFLEKYIFFQALQVASWNIRSFLSLRLESSISQNIINFFRVASFYFGAQKVPSWNIRSFLKNIYFWKYKKSFF